MPGVFTQAQPTHTRTLPRSERNIDTQTRTHTQTNTQTHIHTNTYNVIDSECGRVCKRVSICGRVWKGVSMCGRVWKGVSMCGRVCSECVLERRPRVGRLLKAEASGSNADQLGRLVLPAVEYNNHTHLCSPPYNITTILTGMRTLSSTLQQYSNHTVGCVLLR